MTDNQLFCKECGCGEDHHLIIQRVRELHKSRNERVHQTKTVCYPNGTHTEIEEDVTVCDWCQYLVDFQKDYSYGVAPYPCPTIKALDGEQE